MKLRAWPILLVLFSSSCTISLSSSSTSASSILSSSSSGSESSFSVSSSSESSVSSTSSSSISEAFIDLYSLNDFHGAVEYNAANGEAGLSRIATYFEQKEIANPGGNVILAAGDFWQGSVDSNLTRGALVTEAMNEMNFAAFALGNHDFDWTDEPIIDNLALANFPFLGANIFDKRTNELASFVLPYTMVERLGVQIGIIGTIGSNLESSILASAVWNYDFVPYTSLVIEHAQYLRTEGADIIVLLNHNPSPEPGVLPYVDAVFNGHSHSKTRELLNQKPSLQAGAYGEAIAHIRFKYNFLSNTISLTSYQLDYGALNLSPLASMDALQARYMDEGLSDIKSEVIGQANGYFSRSTLGRLAVREMLQLTSTLGARVAFHNSGGIREDIPSGTVTFGMLYRSFPFENQLVVVEVTGQQLMTWLDYGLVTYGASGTTDTFSNGQAIEVSTTYKIVTINYITEDHWRNENNYVHNIDSAVYTGETVDQLLRSVWLDKGTLNAIDY